MAIHLASLLAVQGLRVMLIDFDPQAHATISYGLAKAPMLYNLLVRGHEMTDCAQVPAPETYCPPGETVRGKLYVLAGNDETHAVPLLVQDTYALRDAIEDIEDRLDVVIIDTAPSPGGLGAMVYSAADYALIPIELERLALDGLAETLRTADRYNVELLGIVPNKVVRCTLHEHNAEKLTQHAAQHNPPWPVFPAIAQRTIWREASQMSQMVYLLPGRTGKARAEVVRMARVAQRRLGVVAHG